MMNMLKIIVVGAVLINAVPIIADDSPVQVQTAGGTSAMVSPSEIRRAYLELVQRKSKNALSLVVNEDGSVAINRPFFEYNGKPLRIDANFSSAKGLCKRFGFQKNLGFEYGKVPMTELVVYLNEIGKLEEILTPTDFSTTRSVLETVACQE